MPRSYKKLKKDMDENVKSGKYLLGELIEPKEYKKFILNTDGKINEVTYTISGRKIPLVDIRRKLYNDHLKLGILRSDTGHVHRNLILWADHAAVLNCGFLLLTIKVIYSNRNFLTDEEMKAKYGRDVNVQQLVESPSIYMLAETSDSIGEKLSYAKTRVEDIIAMKQPFAAQEGKVTVEDTMRFYHGNNY